MAKKLSVTQLLKHTESAPLHIRYEVLADYVECGVEFVKVDGSGNALGYPPWSADRSHDEPKFSVQVVDPEKKGVWNEWRKSEQAKFPLYWYKKYGKDPDTASAVGGNFRSFCGLLRAMFREGSDWVTEELINKVEAADRRRRGTVKTCLRFTLLAGFTTRFRHG